MQQNHMNNLPRNLSALAKDAGLAEHELTGKIKTRAERHKKTRHSTPTKLKSTLLGWLSKLHN